MTGIARFSLPLARPLETTRGRIESREGFLVRIGDDPAGIGEATPLAGWTESLDACREALEDHIGTVDGMETADQLPSMATRPAARHGLELALLDRAARVAGRPLYRHLGGGRRVSAVPVNATVGDADVDGTVAECRTARAEGFRTVKVKVGARDLEADVERVAAAREDVGDDVQLRADANGAWTHDQALTAIEKLRGLDVSYVEQPLSSDDLDGHADLRGRGVGIALDESLGNHGIEAILDAESADVIVLKPMVLGGVGRAAAVAARARSAGLDVVVSTTIDAVVARAAAVHLAAALDVDRACGLATADRLGRDVGSDPAVAIDGAVSVPQGAGHGVGVEALE